MGDLEQRARDAAAEIGRLATQIVKLAPIAGLYVGIRIEAAKPKVADEILAADVRAGMSLRAVAKKHGVGVGIVRGAVARSALHGERGEGK